MNLASMGVKSTTFALSAKIIDMVKEILAISYEKKKDIEIDIEEDIEEALERIWHNDQHDRTVCQNLRPHIHWNCYVVFHEIPKRIFYFYCTYNIVPDTQIHACCWLLVPFWIVY